MLTATAIPQLGLHRNVPFADYLKWPLLSYSVIKHGRAPGGSMKRLKAAYDGELLKPPTDDMVLGQALHVAFLEPELMVSKVASFAGVRRGSQWEQFKEENAGKAILTAKMHDRLIEMTRAIRSHKWVSENVPLNMDTEVSAVGTFHGATVKGRADLLIGDAIVDVKKMSGVDIRTITNTIFRFGYHIQGAVYRKLFDRSRVILICVEDKRPFDCVPVELMDDVLDRGEDEASEVIDQYRFAVKTNTFAGQSDDLLPINVPEWMQDADAAAQITIGGESAFGEDE